MPAEFNILLLSAAKVRRLYDIANVLTSLNLIKKVHVREERGRKPAFEWLGSVDFNPSAGASSKPLLFEPPNPWTTVSRADSKHIRFSFFLFYL